MVLNRLLSIVSAVALGLIALWALATPPLMATPVIAMAFAPLAFAAADWRGVRQAGEASIVAWLLMAILAVETAFRPAGADRWVLMAGLALWGVALANIEARRRRDPRARNLGCGSHSRRPSTG